MSIDVLKHHDRVVDHPTDGYRQAAQRHEVERHVLPRHQQHAREDAERNGHRDDDGRSKGVQETSRDRRLERQHEREDDRHREQEPEHRLSQQGVDLMLNAWPLVRYDDGLHIGRQTFEAVKRVAHGARYVDGVRLRLLDDGHAHAWLAVGAGDARRRRCPEAHVRDVSKTDRAGLRCSHDEVLEVVDGAECVRRLRKDGLSALEYGSRREAYVVLSQSVRYLEHRDPACRQAIGIRGDLDPLLDLTRSLYLQNALDFLKRRKDLRLDDPLQVIGASVRYDAELDHRELVGIEASHRGFTNPAVERYPLYGGVNLVRRRLHVRAVHEGGQHDRVAFEGRRLHRLQP